MILMHLIEMMLLKITSDEIFQSTGQAMFGCVCCVKLGRPQYQYEIHWDTRTHTDLPTLPLGLMEFLFNLFKRLQTITFCTKYKQDVHKFQCHPGYQSYGPIAI
jgi:hypothetical protein